MIAAADESNSLAVLADRIVEQSLPTLLPEESGSPDAIWAEFEQLVRQGCAINESKAQHDIRMLVQIARLWECHSHRWSFFLNSNKLQRRQNAKSEFQPLVMHWLSSAKDSTGRGTKCCVVLNTWAGNKPAMSPEEIPAWLKANRGIDGVYEGRPKKQTSTRDQKDAAIHKLVELGVIATFPLPAEMVHHMDGDYSMLMHVDRIRNTVSLKGIVEKVDQSWLRRNAEAIIATREPAKPAGKPSQLKPIDEFFTKREVAADLYRQMFDIIKERPGFGKVTRWMEPAAGMGAFSDLLPPDRLAIDIAPKTPNCVEADFTTYTEFGDHRYGCVSNPPFSKGMAVKFFNHAARVSEFISFALAPSYANAAQNKFEPHFHLIATLPIPDMAYIQGGKEVHVQGTIFQIWERRDELREFKHRDTPEECADLEFLPSEKGATYIIQRLGERAGRSKPLGSGASRTTHFFIRCDDRAIKILNSIHWPPRSEDNYHLGRPEIIKMYNVKQRALLSKFVH